MSHTNNDQQQLQAVATHQPCIVRASAGSGKTKVLTEHYLQLITSGRCSVKNIIALTFTRKAAAEMYQRIFRLLVEESATHPELEQQIADFTDATITTLDGYCLRIVRSADTLFPFKSEPRIDPSGYEELLEHTAFRTLQTHARKRGFPWANESHSNALHTLLHDLLVFLDRAHLPCTSILDTEKMIALQEQYLTYSTARLHEELLATRERCLSCSEAHSLRRRVADLAPPSIAPLAAVSDDTEAGRTLLGQYAALELRGVKRSADDAVLLKEAVRDLRCVAGQLISIADYRRSFANHAAIYDLMIEFQRRLNAQKMRHGLFSYQNILELAIVALSTNNALRVYLRQSVQAILVDEFQDNNILQKNLLYLLAGAEDANPYNPFAEIDFPASSSIHLFLVGDDKQSIYRFRGADVHLFNAMYQQFKEHNGEQIELKTNYRTHSDLLAQVNDVCVAVFTDNGNDAHLADADEDSEPESATDARSAAVDTLSASPADADGARAGVPIANGQTAVRYHPIGAYWQTDSEYRAHAAPFLSLDYYPIGEDESDIAAAVYREACGIAERIADFMADTQPSIFDTGRYRLAQYDDFAVLLRTRTHIAVIEQALRERDIPYRSDGAVALDDSPAHDLYSLLFLAFYPQSSYHYAAVLRSPWVNCSDEAIQIIIFESRSNNGSAFAVTDITPSSERSSTALDTHLSTMSELLNDDDYRKYHHAALLFHQLRQKMVYASAAEIVNTLWYGGGYHYWLLGDPQEQQGSKLYNALQQLAAESHNLYRFFTVLERTLAEKSFWRERNAFNEESMSYLSAEHGVHILTIHKAKGLEFPVVFLAQSGTHPRRAHKTPILYDDELGYCITTPAGNALFDLRASNRDHHNAEELKRLLYVALTRAQSHLFVSAYAQRHGTEQQTLWDLVTRNKMLTARVHDPAELTPPTAVAPPSLPPPPLSTDELRQRIDSPAAIIEPTVIHLNATAFAEAVYAAIAHPPDPRWQTDNLAATAAATAQPPAASSANHAPPTLVHIAIAPASDTEADTEAPPNPNTPPHPLAIDAVSGIDHKQFGTLCHRLLAEIVGFRLSPQRVLNDEFLNQLIATQYLSIDRDPTTRPALLDSLRNVAQCFFSSTLHDWVTEGLMHMFCERPFVLLQEADDKRYLIHGVIDLLCVDDARKSVYIVDYKSDQVIDTQRYIGQLGCYLAAAEQFYHYPAQAILYGIRSGECQSVNTEHALRFLQESHYYQGFTYQ